MDENRNTIDNNFENKSEQSYSYTPNYNYGYTPQPQPPKNEPPKEPKKNYGIGTIILCIVLSAVISAGAALYIPRLFKLEQFVNETGSNTSEISGNVESIVEAVYEKSANSVVGIRTKASVQNFFGGSTEQTGEGSGVIYSQDGYIITNYHVISTVVSSSTGSSSIEVFLMSDPNTPIDATVVGYNISADLAVIKVEKTGLPAVEIADSSTVKVGQYAIAIGCPGGIEFLNSVSYGIISGLDRVVTVDAVGDMKLIQTDAAINPGNSGGALLNSQGELIGINASKLVDESFEGMGFAIPSNTVVSVVKEIINNKDNPSPYIGIEIYKYSSEYLAQYGLPAGAAVKSVVTSAPAYNAGIRSGDIITSFNNKEITEYSEFIELLDKCTPGTKVTAKIYRNGRYYTTTVTIGSNNSHG